MAEIPENNDANESVSAPKRRRRSRAPFPVILSLRTDLKANDRHPLADLEPATRGEQRERLMASILARLANGRSAVQAGIDTMSEQPKPTTRTQESSESG